jgi:hypothetical protein
MMPLGVGRRYLRFCAEKQVATEKDLRFCKTLPQKD